MSASPIVHFEIMGADGAGLKDFYAKLFDWNTEPVEGFNEYHMVDSDGVGLGGAVGQGSEEMPNYLTLYIEVPDINVQLERVGEAGGSTIMPRTEIPDMVTFALFADPAGNVVGLVESD